jgi:hypothetical protein
MTSIIEIYGRIASHVRRILETLGVERRPRDVTPSLQSYLHPACSLEHPTPSQAFVHHDGPIARLALLRRATRSETFSIRSVHAVAVKAHLGEQFLKAKARP